MVSDISGYWRWARLVKSIRYNSKCFEPGIKIPSIRFWVLFVINLYTCIKSWCSLTTQTGSNVSHVSLSTRGWCSYLLCDLKISTSLHTCYNYALAHLTTIIYNPANHMSWRQIWDRFWLLIYSYFLAAVT